MKTNKKKLSEKLWKLCVEYIRLRDGMICQWCGKRVEKSNAHTSHVIPKSSGNVLRFDAQNLKLLCFHCHMNRWHKNPIDAMNWFYANFPDRYEYLMQNKEVYFKMSEAWLEEEIESYKQRIKTLK